MKKILLLLSIFFLFSYVNADQAINLTCGTSIYENTFLMNDLIDCNRTGIEIAANDIFLDCLGHKIIHNSNFSGTQLSGIYVAGKKNITIKNCYIEGYDNGWGIRIYNVDDSEIKDNVVSDGEGGIEIDESSSNNKISHNFIVNSWANAIRILGNNVSSYNNSIMDNVIIGQSSWYGINLHRTRNNIVKNNVIYCIRFNETQGSGVNLEFSYENVVENNKINSCYNGFIVYYSNSNYFKGNEIITKEDKSRAIYLAQSAYNTIFENNVIGPYSNGIYLSDSGTVNNIFNLNIIKNTKEDIRISLASNNYFAGNAFIDKIIIINVNNKNNSFIGNYWSNFKLNQGYPNNYSSGLLTDILPLWGFCKYETEAESCSRAKIGYYCTLKSLNPFSLQLLKDNRCDNIEEYSPNEFVN